MAGCGGGENPAPSPEEAPAVVARKMTRSYLEREEIPSLDRVVFADRVIAGAPVRTEISDSDGNPFNVDRYPGFTLEYRWFVNQMQVTDVSGDTLPDRYFNSGNLIRCRVLLFGPENRLVKNILSPGVEAVGYPPQLNLPPVTVPSIPGTFTYRISAVDDPRNYPPQSDIPRKLTYRLVAPEGMGIRLNAETGELTWPLTPEIIENLEEPVVTIRFAVENPFRAQATAEIRLQFRSEVRSPEEEGGE
jgi:hypothetical protein